jgi:uncharacterized DUF497 family protein
MSEQVAYDFEWDAVKALANARKHGVTFDQAATVFLDALALTVFDAEHSQQEERWFTLGFDASGALLAVAHTFEATTPTRIRVRLISARPATKRERQFYEDEPR